MGLRRGVPVDPGAEKLPIIPAIWAADSLRNPVMVRILPFASMVSGTSVEMIQGRVGVGLPIFRRVPDDGFGEEHGFLIIFELWGPRYMARPKLFQGRDLQGSLFFGVLEVKY